MSMRRGGAGLGCAGPGRAGLAGAIGIALAGLAMPVAPCLAQSVPVGAPTLSAGSAPSFVTETIGWRGSQAPAFAETPLTALLDQTLGTESEWAPLYRGRDGARIEQAQHRARFARPLAGVLIGADLRRETSRFRGGESDWGFDAGGAPFRSGSAAAGMTRARWGLGASATFEPDGRAGGAMEARVALAPGWRAEARASNVPRAGTLDVRWEDRAVAARGVWSERAMGSRIDGELGRTRLFAALASFDRRPARDAAIENGFEPRLAWRDARLGAARTLAGARVSAEYRHGEGRQRVVVSRTATPYAVIVGPVREDVLVLGVEPAARWDARAWAGQSLNTARGSLALWPFDGLAAIAGTRYVAHSEVSLRHAGICLDGRAAALRGWDGGIAMWALDPSGQYESWRGTFFGLGRDDYDRKGLEANRLLLAGLRLARTQPFGVLSLRLEAVQWAPILTARHHAAPAPASGGSTAAAPAADRKKGRVWGGTVVRLGISLPVGAKLAP